MRIFCSSGVRWRKEATFFCFMSGSIKNCGRLVPQNHSMPSLLAAFRYRKTRPNERLIPNARVERARSRRAFPFKDGILKFHYEVEGSTNFYGWNFPTVFSYVQYQPNRQ